jgi:redox-sensitive bicupin YhaK (pirin superfamily)
MKIRAVKKVFKTTPTIEGAGVHLKRAFGNNEIPTFDPFLLFDDFSSGDPRLYLQGFPWHPHRGIETVTYVLEGNVEHGDSLGNSGAIGAGDVQWMTAGSGIIHQEMPKGSAASIISGFQLWVNLPASHKMMDPRYRGIVAEEIPTVNSQDGAVVRIICGDVDGVRGPVADVVIEPEYLDISIPAGARFFRPTKPGHTVFAYIIEGNAAFEDGGRPQGDGSLVLFEDGSGLYAAAEGGAVRFFLISGKPIGEPIAWGGPIVMNTQAELLKAFDEYQKGTFIKKHA